MIGDAGGVFQEALENAFGFGAARDGDGFHHADAGVQGCDVASLNYRVRDFQAFQAVAEGAEEIIGCCIFTPAFSRHQHLVDVKLIQKLFARNEAAASGGVYDLDIFVVGSPHHDEMRNAVGLNDNGDAGKGAGFREQHMVDGQHDLLRFDAKLVGDFFQRVDGGAIDIGLAGFAQAAIVNVDA